jgi:hypothetical protein
MRVGFGCGDAKLKANNGIIVETFDLLNMKEVSKLYGREERS